MPVRIAIDAMGGDHAPEVVVEGAIAATARFPDDLTVILVGREEEIREFLPESEDDALPEGIEIVHADQVIEMGESPSTALKKKPNSSLHVGLGLLAKG